MPRASKLLPTIMVRTTAAVCSDLIRAHPRKTSAVPTTSSRTTKSGDFRKGVSLPRSGSGSTCAPGLFQGWSSAERLAVNLRREAPSGSTAWFDSVALTTDYFEINHQGKATVLLAAPILLRYQQCLDLPPILGSAGSCPCCGRWIVLDHKDRSGRHDAPSTACEGSIPLCRVQYLHRRSRPVALSLPDCRRCPHRDAPSVCRVRMERPTHTGIVGYAQAW